MKLQTQVRVEKWSEPISYNHPILLMGSCFTENIGNRLVQAGVHASVNPQGITFNPSSICRGLHDMIQGRAIESGELTERDGIWQHWDFHSSLSDLDQEKAAATMTMALAEGGKALGAASHLLVTLGTAWVYELSDEEGRLVNNCHKFPANQFTRRRLEVNEIVTSFSEVIDAMQRFNPDLHIVFTLSPVRHWKDGAEENSISKATLRLAIESLCAANPHCDYFPAYEIMMDELRDYRFYADDLLHPNSMAQAIIWDRFIQAALSEKDHAIAREVQAYHRMLAHRSLHPGSSADQSFKESLEERRRELQERYPEVYLA